MNSFKLSLTGFFLVVFFSLNVSAQNNCSLALDPFQFSASSPKEATKNIREVVLYSKSINNDFNQGVKGVLMQATDDNKSLVCLETRFSGNIEIGGGDYAAITDFIGWEFKEKGDFYFVPQKDAPAWYECRKSGKFWFDMNMVRGKGGNNMIIRFFYPDKDATGKPYPSEYEITSIKLNDEDVPLAKGQKGYGVIKINNMYADTIVSTSGVMKVEMKIKGLGKYKFLYIDKNKGEDFSQFPIKGFQFYNLPAKTIVSDSLFFSMSRVGAYNIKPEDKYEACIVLTLSNGKECPLTKKDKFTVQPTIHEFKTKREDTLQKRTLSSRNGSLIYRYLFDIPLGASAVSFNYSADVNCENGGEPDKGHINSCSVFIFRNDE